MNVFTCRREKKKDNNNALGLPPGMTLAEYQSLRGSMSYLHPYYDIDGRSNIYDRLGSVAGGSNTSYVEPYDHGEKPYIYSRGLRYPSARYVPEPKEPNSELHGADYNRNTQPYRRHLPEDRLHPASPFIEDLANGSRRIHPQYMTSIKENTLNNHHNSERQNVHSYLELQNASPVSQEYITGGHREPPDEQETTFSYYRGEDNRQSTHSYLDIVPDEAPQSPGSSGSSESSGQNSRRTASSRSKSDSGISGVFMVNDDIVY